MRISATPCGPERSIATRPRAATATRPGPQAAVSRRALAPRPRPATPSFRDLALCARDARLVAAEPRSCFQKAEECYSNAVNLYEMGQARPSPLGASVRPGRAIMTGAAIIRA